MAKNCIILLLALLITINTFYPIYGANILAVLPSVWKSHYLFGRRLLQQLVLHNNSHTVTLIRPKFDYEEPELPRIKEISIMGMQEKWKEMGITFNVEAVRKMTSVERMTRLIYAGTANVDLVLLNEDVRKVLKSGAKFDLFFVDLFMSDSLMGLAQYYDIPTVVISASGSNPWLNRMLGNPHSSATDPSLFLPYSARMDIWERCMNTLMGLFEKLTYNFFHMTAQESMYRKHFESCTGQCNAIPHHRELTKNISLVLINSHPILQYPRAYLPNMIEIAGAHYKSFQEMKLPTHLNAFIEGAPKGVIYMSLGANLRTMDMGRDKLEAFLDVFSDLTGMRVLIKWESKYFLGDQPKNVLLNPWFPQEAILMHQNVKLFITTCGIMSIEESINGLTPMLAMPILPYQEALAKRLHSHGVALTLPFNSITHSEILESIEQLTSNASYYENMKQLHRILCSKYNGDPVLKSLDYIEFVMNTGGADFLKSPANELNFFRAKLFDVIAILTLVIGSILAIPFLIICLILRKSYHTHVAQVTSLCNYPINGNTPTDSSSCSSKEALVQPPPAAPQQPFRPAPVTNPILTRLRRVSRGAD